MKALEEYTEATSEYELFSFLSEKVISKAITRFSELREMTSPILKSQRTHPVIMRVFELIRKFNWGFFSDMAKETHARLWKELVIPDSRFPEAGDLKDTLQISNLYVAMLDIHGYTQFCMDSRKNLSMMHTLDWAMNTEVRRISTVCQAVSQRERGDEMVVVAASATDALTVTLAIMDYFGKTTLEQMRTLTFDELTQMTGEYATATGRRLSFSPVVENYFLTGSFSDMARAGEIPNIPYMFGFTANDMSNATKPIQDFCALREQKGGKPAYAYLFSRQLPGDASGAFHSADLWYVFHSLRHSWRPFTAGDEKLSLKIVDYWTNFAKFGNPNGQGAGDWTPYSSTSPKFMVFDADETKAILTMTDTPTFLGPSARN